MTRARSPLRFFALVFALSIPIWLVEPDEWPITAAVGTPLLAGMLLEYEENRSAGVRSLLGRVFDCRRIRSRTWYLPALLLMPALSLMSYAVMRMAGAPLRAESSNLLLAVPAFFALFFVLAIGEAVRGNPAACQRQSQRIQSIPSAARHLPRPGRRGYGHRGRSGRGRRTTAARAVISSARALPAGAPTAAGKVFLARRMYLAVWTPPSSAPSSPSPRLSPSRQ